MKKINKKIVIILFIVLVVVPICIFMIVKNNSNSINALLNGETVTLQNSEISYSNNRSDYETDEQFANFRLLNGGNIKPIIYRGASPVNNSYNRASTVIELLEKYHIGFVIDLADDEASLKEHIEKNQYYLTYINGLKLDNKIYLGNLSTDYSSKEYAESMAKALIQIAKNDGPYYIHCTHGRDRTGMACMILEALSGASLQEILDDYMKTYENYSNITQTSDNEMYNKILKSRFKNELHCIIREENVDDYLTYDYKKAAEEYLKYGGLTEQEIDELETKITNI